MTANEYLVCVYAALKSASLLTFRNFPPQKLDPAVVEFHIIAAGSLLARLGRPEVSTCIVGLEQYSHSYEEAGDHAQEIRKTYDSVRNGNGDQHMNHMSRIIKQIPAFPSATAEPDVPPGAQEPVSPSMASFQMSGMNMDGAGSLMEVDDEMGLGAHKNEVRVAFMF